MSNTKTITLATKLHSVIHNDSGDQEYISSQGRYGRQSLSTREYIFNGFNYGNNYNAYVEAMDIANYDPNHMVDSDVICNRDNEKVWKLYCDTVGGTDEDKAIFPRAKKQELRDLKVEANRLLNLKSKKSHEKGQSLLDLVNDPKWKALEAKQKKAMHATSIVNQWAWQSHHETKARIDESFKTTGQYTYISSWK